MTYSTRRVKYRQHRIFQRFRSVDFYSTEQEDPHTVQCMYSRLSSMHSVRTALVVHRHTEVQMTGWKNFEEFLAKIKSSAFRWRSCKWEVITLSANLKKGSPTGYIQRYGIRILEWYGDVIPFMTKKMYSTVCTRQFQLLPPPLAPHPSPPTPPLSQLPL